MTKRKRKKPKKQKQPVWLGSTAQRQLVDRVLIGLLMQTPPIVDDGCVAAYILNPGVRGPRKLTVRESSTWPVFDSLAVTYDDRMLSTLRIKESELVPFWMRRFIASTEEELMFGYMFTPGLDRYRLEVKTLSFDYKLASELFGGPPERLKIPKERVLEAVGTCVDVMAEGTGSQFKFTYSYAVDPGPDGWVESKGGEA